MTGLEDISLRERKAARTRLALLEATLRRVKQQPFDEVSIRDLCADAQISVPTFSNYFPKKWQLIVHYIDLWSLEMRARIAAEGLSGLAAVERVFELTAGKVADNPAWMLEIIGQQARFRGVPESPTPITVAQRLLAFPELPEALDVEPQALPVLFGHQILAAIEAGELPAEVDVERAVLFVVSTFFGMAMVAAPSQPEQLGELYRQQLRFGFSGLAGAAKPTTR